MKCSGGESPMNIFVNRLGLDEKYFNKKGAFQKLKGIPKEYS